VWHVSRKPEGNRPHERHRHGWENNIKMDVKEIGCDDMDWVPFAQDQNKWQLVVNMIMNLQAP
jgi:hypothetical protein